MNIRDDANDVELLTTGPGEVWVVRIRPTATLSGSKALTTERPPPESSWAIIDVRFPSVPACVIANAPAVACPDVWKPTVMTTVACVALPFRTICTIASSGDDPHTLTIDSEALATLPQEIVSLAPSTSKETWV